MDEYCPDVSKSRHYLNDVGKQRSKHMYKLITGAANIDKLR